MIKLSIYFSFSSSLHTFVEYTPYVKLKWKAVCPMTKINLQIPLTHIHTGILCQSRKILILE